MAWEIDPHHTQAEFAVKHLMITTIKGRFPQVQGTLHFDPKHPEESWVRAQVKTESIYTGLPQRDAHLRSADFFDVVKYPTITFESKRVERTGAQILVAYGDLSLHGVTQEVPFQVRYTGLSKDIFTGAYRIGLIAATTIDRRNFGMTYNQMKENIMLIGHEVSIEIHSEAVLME